MIFLPSFSSYCRYPQPVYHEACMCIKLLCVYLAPALVDGGSTAYHGRSPRHTLIAHCH
jgi:hypothetical protein